MKAETIEKYKIEWNRKKNEYISLIDPDYQYKYYNYY